MSEGKASVRYFTGTGNSRRIAEVCAREFEASGLGADLSAMPGGGAPASDAVAACFVFPVYSLDMPRIVRRYLEALPPAGGRPRPALLLATGGDPDDCGWTLAEGRGILADRGYDALRSDLVPMPNNWGPFMRVPDKAEGAAIAAAGEERARESARAFLRGERYAKPISLAKFGPLGSRLLRSGFKLGVKRLWRLFRATEACKSCGLCAASCPTGSIEMAGGRPRWSASCEQCMRCFNLCPKRAIEQLEAIGHGSRRERWMEPHFAP